MNPVQDRNVKHPEYAYDVHGYPKDRDFNKQQEGVNMDKDKFNVVQAHKKENLPQYSEHLDKNVPVELPENLNQQNKDQNFNIGTTQQTQTLGQDQNQLGTNLNRDNAQFNQNQDFLKQDNRNINTNLGLGIGVQNFNPEQQFDKLKDQNTNIGQGSFNQNLNKDNIGISKDDTDINKTTNFNKDFTDLNKDRNLNLSTDQVINQGANKDQNIGTNIQQELGQNTQGQKGTNLSGQSFQQSDESKIRKEEDSNIMKNQAQREEFGQTGNLAPRTDLNLVEFNKDNVHLPKDKNEIPGLRGNTQITTLLEDAQCKENARAGEQLQQIPSVSSDIKQSGHIPVKDVHKSAGPAEHEKQASLGAVGTHKELLSHTHIH